MDFLQRLPLQYLLPAGSTLAAVFLSSCGSTTDYRVKDSGIKVRGASATPSHRMSKYDYPFDSNGTYITSWAEEGERRAGRSTSGSRSSSRKTHHSKPKAPPKPSFSYHKVGPGDTLWGISRKYGSSVSRIKSYNGLRSDTIRTGSTLKIPR